MTASPPVAARLRLLPLNDLEVSWEQFQTFSQAFIAAKPEVQKAEAYGRHGDPQDGIDIVAFLRDGNERTYQCRQRQRFSLSDATETIADTNRPQATEHVIIVACEVGKKVRDHIHSLRPKWDILDVTDVSLAIRHMPREIARDIIEDAFGAAIRRAFLGPDEHLVFVTPERYFRGFERPRGLFRHDWQLAGRHRQVAALTQAVGDPEIRAVILSGRGGIGKTRLLRELSTRAGDRRILFALDDVDITPEAVDTLPLADAVVVVDDVHRRGAPTPLIARLARHGDDGSPKEQEADDGPLTLVLSSRPQAIDALRADLLRAGLGPQEIRTLDELGDLDRDDIELLAREALGPEFERWGSELADVSADCPLVTVVGGQLLALRKLHPRLLSHDEDFRSAVLHRFSEEMLGELGAGIDRSAAARVLVQIAALAPLSIDNEPALRAMAAEARINLVQLRGLLAELVKCGLLAPAGRLRRIVPDVLADHLLHSACRDGAGHPTGYARELYDRYGTVALGALLRNLAELDWRIGHAGDGSTVLDEVWQTMTRRFRAAGVYRRAELLTQLGPAADLAPERVLDLVETALDNPAAESRLAHPFNIEFGDKVVRAELPALLRRAGAHPEHAARALALLWRVARDHTERSALGGTDPIEAMRNVGGYGTGNKTSVEALLVLVEHLLSGIEEEAPVSPLELLRDVLKRDGTDLVRVGFGFAVSPYVLLAAGVAPVRTRTFRILAGQARDGTPRNRALATSLLSDALDQPHGRAGMRVDRETFDGWLDDQLIVLERVSELMVGTAPLVRSTLRNSVSWHAKHSAWPAAARAAQRIVDEPEADDEQLWTAFTQPFYFDREQEQDERRLLDVAERLGDLSAAEIAGQLSAVATEATDGAITAHPEWLFGVLAHKSAGRVAEVCSLIASEQADALVCYLGKLLAALDANAPDRVDALLPDLDRNRLGLRRQIALYMSRRSGSRADTHHIATLRELLDDPDEQVRLAAMDALIHASGNDAPLLELALGARIGRSTELGARMSLVLCHSGGKLSTEQLTRALHQIRDVEELEYASVELLRLVGAQLPEAVCDMLLARIDASNDDGFREVIPWHTFAGDVLAGADDDLYMQLLRRVRDHALGHREAGHMLSRLYWHLNRDANLSLLVLHEWLTSDDADKVRTAGALLGGARHGDHHHVADGDDPDPGELLQRPWYAVDVLHCLAHADAQVRTSALEALRDTMIDYEVHRTYGQPDERHVCALTIATTMVDALPRHAPARRLYAELVEHMTDRLEEERLEDAEFGHRLR